MPLHVKRRIVSHLLKLFVRSSNGCFDAPIWAVEFCKDCILYRSVNSLHSKLELGTRIQGFEATCSMSYNYVSVEIGTFPESLSEHSCALKLNFQGF